MYISFLLIFIYLYEIVKIFRQLFQGGGYKNLEIKQVYLIL